jgi:uncharacterized protein (TIGR00288 family)
MSDTRYTPNIAIFADFENVAIGLRNARYGSFDVQLILERLLDKGNIVVKKAYADWTRYKTSRRPLHEAAFELIEIPHVSYSGKNSADIRMVVDALDLCYTKDHIDLFVLITGDSDFSPLVSKLRENAKKVIALGVKNSSSELLIENCDEFIYYDDLVREQRKAGAPSSTKPRRKPRREPEPEPVVEPEIVEVVEPPKPKGSVAERKTKALEMVLEVVDSLFRERDDNVWGSVVKQTIKRKRPNFSETFHGYRNFTEVLLDAQTRGMLELQKDERSGGYLILGFGPNA